MKISVITPTFNSEASIRRNIQSVNVQLHPETEHIFIDNLSSDQTVSMINNQSKRSPKIVSEKDRGISDAFNKGIRIASGDIISILNSDDAFFDEHTLERVTSAFLAEPDLEFVHGNMLFVDPVHGSQIRRPLQGPITKAMPFNHPAFFVRKSFYDKLGLFDESFSYAMDFELICRLYLNPLETKLKGYYIEGAPLAVMHSGGASTVNELKSVEEAERALKKNQLWNLEAQKALSNRRNRIHLKNYFSKWGLGGLIKVWRFFKWR
ncbi:MAG: glycosyltransferase [Proteobacteria bacterium]|nr:glycosyltransferase [Pseudomonadota bacterium]NDC23138.1 glycosyltransferase [Pseudomonadota bacterium]NDD03329.1 glycosyltransferase [Pseudomonadota bacterium]NDG25720.1 glycosyltransferase [Pseudomonadota bacterium]